MKERQGAWLQYYVMYIHISSQSTFVRRALSSKIKTKLGSLTASAHQVGLDTRALFNLLGVKPCQERVPSRIYATTGNFICEYVQPCLLYVATVVRIW